jgi:hypothetical protein
MFLWGVKLNTHSSSAKVKNEWGYTSIPSHIHGMPRNLMFSYLLPLNSLQYPTGYSCSGCNNKENKTANGAPHDIVHTLYNVILYHQNVTVS